VCPKKIKNLVTLRDYQVILFYFFNFVKMSESNHRSYDEVLEQDVIWKYECKVIEYMRLGNSRRGLVYNIRKVFEKLSTPQLRERILNRFLRNIVSGIQGQQAFSQAQSCLMLYGLWEGLQATSIQWAWLHELVWYRRPTVERLADDEFRSEKNAAEASARQAKRNRERSIGDSPPKKRGPDTVSPVNNECVVSIASIVVVPEPTKRIKEQNEETELRERILSRIQEEKEVNPGLQQVSSWLSVSVVSKVSNVSRSPSEHFMGALSKEYLEIERVRNAQNVILSDRKSKVYV
jgi:hypothetical protein